MRLGSHLPHISKCLKLWNPHKTFKENYDYLKSKGYWKSGYTNLSSLASNNGLVYLPFNHHKIEWIKRNWDKSKTLSQNAKNLKMLYSTAVYYSYCLNLPYKKVVRGLVAEVAKRALAIQLCEAGYTYQKIGLLFGTSRQKVEQLIKRPSKKVVKGQLESNTNGNSYKKWRK